MNAPRAGVKRALLSLVALVLLFEEWGWEQLAALLARLGRLSVFAAFEGWIRSLPPWGALAAFALPALALLPAKLLALFLIAGDHAMFGVTVLLAAKFLGTALVARLFTLTLPTLMLLAWFAHWYPRWKAWKDGLMAQVRNSPFWVGVQKVTAATRMRWARFRSTDG